MADLLAQHFTSLGVFITDYSDLCAPPSTQKPAETEATVPPQNNNDKKSVPPPPYSEHGAHKLVETSAGPTPYRVDSTEHKLRPDPLQRREVGNGRQSQGESQAEFEIGPELTLIPVGRST